MAKNAAVDLWQQQAKDGGRRGMIGELSMKKWGITCAGENKIKSI